MKKIIGKPAIKDSERIKADKSETLSSEMTNDEVIAHLEKWLSKNKTKGNPETIEQVEYQLAQLKSGI